MSSSDLITADRFNLLRYFIITALIAMILFTSFYTYYLSNKVKEAMFKEKISFSKVVAQKLEDDIKHKIMLPILNKNGDMNPNAKSFRQKMDQLMQEYRDGFDIRQINLIQKDRLIVYSTNKDLEGIEGKDSSAFQKAISGKIGTKLEYFPEDKAKTSLEIFLPFELQGKIVGTMMIYQDINDVITIIKDNQWDIIRTSIGFMSLLFLILFLIIKRGDKIIKQQRDKLVKFNRELETEVKARTKRLKVLNQELKEQAIKDGLTGLYNHTEIKRRLDKFYCCARLRNEGFSCLMIDIDYFKRINDNFGHQFGDEVLKYVSNIINKNIRKNDVVGRYGGEEFVVILSDANYNEAYNMAERIRKDICQQRFINNGQVAKISVSIGIGMYAEEVNTPDEILKEADEFLYQAKNNGRNQVLGEI